MSLEKMEPDVRFKGYIKDWLTKELADVLVERKVSQRISNDAPILAFAAGQGVIDRSERKSNNRDHLTIDQENKKYKLTEYDDIVYNPSNLKYGAIDRNKHGRGVISPIYVTFTTVEISSFIEQIVKSEKFKLRALVFEEGTVVKRQSVKPENLLSLEVNISPSLDEQAAIGNTFSKLDSLINQHQQKHDKLSIIKKAMLEKMFPRQGETVPEIRFKEFSGEWEVKELKEICTYHSSTLTVSDAETEGQYKLYDAQKCIGYTDRNIQDSDYITIIKDGSGVGRVRILPQKSSFLATMGAIKPKETDLHFLYCCLIKIDFNKHISGATIPHVYFRDYGREEFKISTLDEQTAIGSYFKKLDSLINQHQQQITKFNNIKQACLSKMFV